MKWKLLVETYKQAIFRKEAIFLSYIHGVGLEILSHVANIPLSHKRNRTAWRKALFRAWGRKCTGQTWNSLSYSQQRYTPGLHQLGIQSSGKLERGHVRSLELIVKYPEISDSVVKIVVACNVERIYTKGIGTKLHIIGFFLGGVLFASTTL